MSVKTSIITILHKKKCLCLEHFEQKYLQQIEMFCFLFYKSFHHNIYLYFDELLIFFFFLFSETYQTIISSVVLYFVFTIEKLISLYFLFSKDTVLNFFKSCLSTYSSIWCFFLLKKFQNFDDINICQMYPFIFYN